ncbi:MAG: hypothetical protein H7331_12655 [Bacteroidia bacterium]|nr:hypothetical protein [Bacteroidia bacterium]
MNKIIINKKFEIALYVLVSISLLSVSQSLIEGNIFSVIGVVLDVVVLFFLYTKNTKLSVGIKLWCMLIALGPFFKSIAGILKIIGSRNVDYLILIQNIIVITLAILVYKLSNKYISAPVAVSVPTVK